MKYWMPEDGEDITVRFLGQPKDCWYVDHGVLMHDFPSEPQICVLGGPFDQNIEPKRTSWPVMHDGKLKTLSLGPAATKNLTRLIDQALEDQRLSTMSQMYILNQNSDASRFKRSKMVYGAKR